MKMMLGKGGAKGGLNRGREVASVQFPRVVPPLASLVTLAPLENRGSNKGTSRTRRNGDSSRMGRTDGTFQKNAAPKYHATIEHAMREHNPMLP